MSTTPNVPMRERVGVYEKAGFPNYPKPDAEGYPIASTSAGGSRSSRPPPDHYETFRPKLDNPNDPTAAGKNRDLRRQREYKDVPGAMLRFGNLPAMMNASVHSGEDVILTADRPRQRARARLDGQHRGVPGDRRSAGLGNGE